MAEWSKALPQTARCLSLLTELGSQPGNEKVASGTTMEMSL